MHVSVDLNHLVHGSLNRVKWALVIRAATELYRRRLDRLPARRSCPCPEEWTQGVTSAGGGQASTPASRERPTTARLNRPGMYEQAVTNYERVLGADHPKTAMAQRNLDNARVARSDPDGRDDAVQVQ